MEQLGFMRSVAEPQLFWHSVKRVLVSVHADDLLVAGSSEAVDEFMGQVAKHMKIKWGERLLPSAPVQQWVRYLGKEWKRTPTGFLVRTPVSYMEQILALVHLEHAKGAPTPFLSSVPADETPLDAAAHSLYRTAVGKMMWMMSERGDLAFPVKELARSVQAPTVGDMLLAPRCEVLDHHAEMCRRWLGTHSSRRIRCAYTLMRAGRHLPTGSRLQGGDAFGGLPGFELCHWARTQPVIAQSSCEAELLALNTGASEGRLVHSIMMELEMPVQLRLLTDSASAKAVTLRRGPGRMRHIEIRQLWLQEECRQHSLSIDKVSTLENDADMFTKAVSAARLRELCSMLGLEELAEGNEQQ